MTPQQLQRGREALLGKIRAVPDFPKPGILFRDITPLLGDAESLALGLELHLALLEDVRDQIDAIVGIESRGFLYGMALAQALRVGFIPVRKPGKLPAATYCERYDLEYGSSELHIHADAVQKGQRVVIVDDLLATGGTAAACCRLVERVGGSVLSCIFLVELSFLPGRAVLEGRRVDAVVTY